MKTFLRFLRRPAPTAGAEPKYPELEATGNASCLQTRRPIYVMLLNRNGTVDTYAAHYVDSVWNGGWWYYHVTCFEDWSRYSLALYLRPTMRPIQEQHLH